MSVNIHMRSSCRVTGEQWILTTVNSLYPTDISNILSRTHWNLIVLGEKETPKNWSIRYSSSKLLYLSYEEQIQSGFSSARFIPVSSSAQRNVGYLIAIFCGAQQIYELTERIQIWDSKFEFHTKAVRSTDMPWLGFSVLRSNFINIYGMFGQPNIWPRGLPITEVQNILESGWSSVRRNDHEHIYPYIQQQLVDYNPDIDSITRDLRRAQLKHTVFDQRRGPIALEPLTFSPYNAKSTFHHYESFWGLFLPITVYPSNADIWRSFFTQRLLWDIGGHLIFLPINTTKRLKKKHTSQHTKYEQIFNAEIADFVHFLSSWKTDASTLSERILQLMTSLIKADFLDESEYSAMRAWLNDLSSVKYIHPRVIDFLDGEKSPRRIRRAAVCVTGLAECIEEVWAKNEIALRRRINGDLDVFLFLSSGSGFRENSGPSIDNLRLQQARLYNATANIVHQDTVDIDPGFPPTCNYYYIFTKRQKIIPIEQERLAQAKCYNVIREYEKKRRLKYELLIRARSDSIFTRLPKTFERNGKYNPDTMVMIPDEHHYYGINDRFAIGPIESMRHYMCRWYQLPLCLTNNVHPESFLAYILEKNNVTVTRDIEVSLVQVPHGESQCH